MPLEQGQPLAARIRSQFSGGELEGNHTHRVIIFTRGGRTLKRLAVARGDILWCAPWNHPSLCDAARALEVNGMNAAAIQEEMRRLAISPDPACRMYPFQYRRDLANKTKGLT